MNDALLLSVVVIGRNEGDRLRRCLESVAAMRRVGFGSETIYVDSGSTDASLALAAGLGVRTIALNAVRPTAALGRNAGWRAARGELVLFLDGDTVLDPRFVAGSLGEFAKARTAIVWGHRRELFPQATLYNRVLDLDWIYATGLTAFCGGDALFRRKVLEATGGFDETLIAGEEPELCRRILALGLQIMHVDLPMTGHDLAMTRFGQYWKRATRAGHAFAEVSGRFAGTANPFWLTESQGNRKRGTVLATVLPAALIVCLWLRSVWPLVVVVALLILLAVRTAWKARWKSADRVALLLYGVHSHFQQVPILVGQVQFWMNQRRGKQAGLVEYKGR